MVLINMSNAIQKMMEAADKASKATAVSSKRNRDDNDAMAGLCTVCVSLGVSSAGCERAFSCMKRIKTYLMSSMSDERLGELAVLNVNIGRTSDLDLNAVVTRFGQSEQHRIELF